MHRPCTIFALASAPGRAGISVLRISGDQALAALNALGIDSAPPARIASLRTLHASGETLDQALILWFPAPHSFTGEDVAELHLHGSRAVLASVTEILRMLPGVRLAEPGEFTRRAFLNHRMDLSEVEGLIDLIDAETQAQARQALRALEGKTGSRFEQLRADILHLLAHVEAYIDFPDEDIPAGVLETIHAKAHEVCAEIRHFLADSSRGERIREGVNVVILGAPNAGKSSLINALAARDVAIVSHVAGTTRDIIEVHMNIAGYPVILVDTAGLRDSADPLEQEGIRRARERAARADIRLVLLDGTQLPALDAESLSLISGETVVAISKADALAVSVAPPIQGHQPLLLSASTGAGIEALFALLAERLNALLQGDEPPLITRARHKTALEAALEHLERFLAGGPIELSAEELRLSALSVGKITGKIAVDELLDRIFKDFCIGK